MTSLKITIDRETLQRLAASAVAERRPLDLQAEVLLMRQLGCWPGEHMATAPEQRVALQEATCAE